MKLSNIALAMAMTLFIAGAAHAATTADSVSKKITLTALFLILFSLTNH